MAFSNRLSLHIGVNRVDRTRYTGTKHSVLCGCENDARSMADVATANCFTVLDLLVNERATFNRVADYLEYVVNELDAGDAFLFTFSGHGASLVYSSLYANGAEDSDMLDERDEGFVLYDLVMKDNYLNTYLRRFKPGVRVILVADCCHSRTIHSFGSNSDEHNPPDDSSAERCRKNRWMKLEKGSQTSMRQKELYKLYDNHYSKVGLRLNNQNIQADMVLLSACDDNQMAADGPDHGAFTKAILEVLRSGANGDGMPFIGSYKQFVDVIKMKTGSAQVPEATLLGPNTEENKLCRFFQGPPFTLNN